MAEKRDIGRILMIAGKYGIAWCKFVAILQLFVLLTTIAIKLSNDLTGIITEGDHFDVSTHLLSFHLRHALDQSALRDSVHRDHSRSTHIVMDMYPSAGRPESVLILPIGWAADSMMWIPSKNMSSHFTFTFFQQMDSLQHITNPSTHSALFSCIACALPLTIRVIQMSP